MGPDMGSITPDESSDGDGRWRSRARDGDAYGGRQSQSMSDRAARHDLSHSPPRTHHHRSPRHRSAHRRHSRRSHSPRRRRRRSTSSLSTSSDSRDHSPPRSGPAAMALMDASAPVRKTPCPCRRCKGVVDQDGSTILSHCGTHGRYVPPPHQVIF